MFCTTPPRRRVQKQTNHRCNNNNHIRCKIPAARRAEPSSRKAPLPRMRLCVCMKYNKYVLSWIWDCVEQNYSVDLHLQEKFLDDCQQRYTVKKAISLATQTTAALMAIHVKQTHTHTLNTPRKHTHVILFSTFTRTHTPGPRIAEWPADNEVTPTVQQTHQTRTLKYKPQVVEEQQHNTTEDQQINAHTTRTQKKNTRQYAQPKARSRTHTHVFSARDIQDNCSF